MTTMQQHTQRMALLNNHEYEQLIGRLYELLKADDLDRAMDLVRAEFDAIHGPSNGSAG